MTRVPACPARVSQYHIERTIEDFIEELKENPEMYARKLKLEGEG